MHKLIRVTTISLSLDKLLKGQLHFLNNYFEVIGVASDIGSLAHVGTREGIRVIDLPMEREISMVKDVVSLFRMIRLFLKEKPHIVHANTPKGSFLAMLAARLCGVPHRIYTVTGLRFETAEGNFRKVLIMMEKITCACATKVIPEGDGVKTTLLREKITAKPLHKIHNGNINGIDLTYFDPSLYTESDKRTIQQSLNIQPDDFVFIFIGRLSKDKGINELVSAFHRLNLAEDESLQNKYDGQRRNVKLLLVGPFEQHLDPLLPKTLELLKSDNHMILTGYKDDIRPYLLIADALTFPSYREGFPNVVMQAGAMGIPSIVTDISGSNEIIIEGKNGVIIPPQNEDALLHAMNDFLNNSELVKSMANQARQLIANRFNQQKVWEELLKVYQKMN
jgi:glycosyltransferase involved in cell wall biosynthesis